MNDMIETVLISKGISTHYGEVLSEGIFRLEFAGELRGYKVYVDGLNDPLGSIS